MVGSGGRSSMTLLWPMQSSFHEKGTKGPNYGFCGHLCRDREEIKCAHSLSTPPDSLLGAAAFVSLGLADVSSGMIK